MGSVEGGPEIQRTPSIGSFDLLTDNAVVSPIEHDAAGLGWKVARMPVAERGGRTLVVTMPKDVETKECVQAALALVRNGADRGHIEIDTTGEVNG